MEMNKNERGEHKASIPTEFQSTIQALISKDKRGAHYTIEDNGATICYAMDELEDLIDESTVEQPGKDASDLKADEGYDVSHKIGEGGMGIVYAARDAALQREVAMKVYRSKTSEDPALSAWRQRQFTGEACMTALLDHPNVVPIYALVSDQDGKLFFTMKKISGYCWSDLLHPEELADEEVRKKAEARSRGMTWRDHFEILLKVADAVAYAHNKGVVHRDLKPENVMIGAFGEVYVMDWGLAMFYDERNPWKKDENLAPLLAGTPSFMPPEMAMGKMTWICPATDVYLLGGILYELITTEPPHSGRDMSDVINNAAMGRFKPLTQFHDNPLINPAITRIVHKALAPGIEERYATVAALCDDVREYLDHLESLTLSEQSHLQLEQLTADLTKGMKDDIPVIKQIPKGMVVYHYEQLTECVLDLRQAMIMWDKNEQAQQILAESLILHISFAIEQNNLVAAGAQLHKLEAFCGVLSNKQLAQNIQHRATVLRGRLGEMEKKRAMQQKQVLGLKIAAAVSVTLLVVVLTTLMFMARRQRAMAEQSQLELFKSAVKGQARTIKLHMEYVERIVKQYRLNAEYLMALEPEQLPYVPPVESGRNGFFYDEDFYDQTKRPANMVFRKAYQTEVSLKHATVVRAPWARDGEALERAERDAHHLGRLSQVFSQVHETYDVIMWSLAGSKSGLLVGFPGYGRYKDKQDYDPTQRPWYAIAIQARDDRPVWGDLYVDATTRKPLISCMARIHVGEENIGVVGMEVSLETVQNILRDFSSNVTSGMRCLLARRYPQDQDEASVAAVRYQVVIDTDFSLEQMKERPERKLVSSVSGGQSFLDRMCQHAELEPAVERCGDKVIGGAFVRGNEWIFMMISSLPKRP